MRVSGSELDGKVAVVTGGGRGIGRAICLLLAANGANVAVADIDAVAARESVEMIEGGQALFVQTDVSSEDSVRRLFGETMERFGRVDVAVSSAGIFKIAPILEIETGEWDRVLAVNLRGTFLVCREAFRIMKEQGSGKIVNVASTAGKTGGVHAGAHYSASKAGVICFTKSLALQAAPYKINANVVCPGPTATELTEAWGEETNRELAARIPWKEYARPEDVAEAVVFLASDRARYITGEVLDVNGGLVMD